MIIPHSAPVMWRAWWIMVIGPLLGAGLGFLAAYLLVSPMPDLYQGSAAVAIDRIEANQEPLADYVERMVSTNILRQVSRNLELPSRWNLSEKEVMEELEDSLRVSVGKGSNVVEVVALHPMAVDSRDLVAEFIRVYAKHREKQDKAEAKQVLLGVKAALRDQEAEVERRREAMQKFLQKDSSYFDQLHNNPQAIDQYHQAKRDLETSERLLGKLNQDLKREESKTYTSRESVVIQQAAKASSAPVAPNRTLWMILGSSGGFLFALPISLLVSWLWSRGSVKADTGQSAVA